MVTERMVAFQIEPVAKRFPLQRSSQVDVKRFHPVGQAGWLGSIFIKRVNPRKPHDPHMPSTPSQRRRRDGAR